MSEAKIENILEFCGAGTSARLDKAASVIRGVKILGTESANGRRYPAATIRAAAAMYEGAKVNINHPPQKELSQPRNYQDRIGTLRNVTVRPDGLFGDLHYNPQHVLAPQLEWDAEHAPENVGLSHNIEGKVTKRSGKTIVEEISKVTSVDLVADPATTKGLFEGVAVDGDSARKALIEQLAIKVGYPAWCPPAVELRGLEGVSDPTEIEAYLVKRTDHVRELLREEKTSSRRKLAAWDRIPADCNLADAQEFISAIGGRPSHAEQERFHEAVGLRSLNGHAKKFASDIT